jgi:hypothetical protein
MVLRGLAAAAAATAVVGAVVMRRWDTQAGKQVADLTRARASDEWRHEERVAELETDLEESRELRVKLEQRLRAKRAELAGLRNEHAALLRRYATAEADRASVLEERRVLEIEAAAPTRALPPAPVAAAGSAGPSAAAREAGAVAAPAEGTKAEGTQAEPVDETPVTASVFSPEGSRLFLRAKAALARFDGEESPAPEGDGSAEDGESSAGDSPHGLSEDGSSEDGSSEDRASKSDSVAQHDSPNSWFPKDEPPRSEPPKGSRPSNGEPVKAGSSGTHTGAAASQSTESSAPGGAGTQPASEDEAQGKPEAADGHERAAATTTADAAAEALPALPAAQQHAGHFIAPTAVAVVPATPARRPVAEGSFDFFGTKQGAEPSALESVQNEDLADVVGQEALALHKAESEAEFKPADEESRGIGQVIDLTAHDETEQIDVQGLRSAVS